MKTKIYVIHGQGFVNNNDYTGERHFEDTHIKSIFGPVMIFWEKENFYFNMLEVVIIIVKERKYLLLYQ